MEPNLFPVVLLSVTREQKGFACCGEGCGAHLGSDLRMKRSSLCIDRDARKNSPEGFLSGYHMVFAGALIPLQFNHVFRALTSLQTKEWNLANNYFCVNGLEKTSLLFML